MKVAQRANEDQTAQWNGVAGRAWVEAQESLDRLFKPFEDLLVEAVAARHATRVLDIGCGTGSTTLAIAGQVGAQGRSVGLDISEPMIALARARAEREGAHASFICADAQTHAFEAASFDMIVSRFGIMFFDDPVRAFANLRYAAKDDAELKVIPWRSATDNPFMTTAERAAAPFLPELPARRPGAPGQFAFADRGRVHAILEKRLGRHRHPAVDVTCVLPERELPYLTRLGPVGLVLQHADEATRKES
jgi:SAM-dependent methyltransferase